MDQQLKSNITSSKHWLRLLFMLFFAVCLQVSFIVMTAVVCVQFLFALVTGEDNRQLRSFGDSLSQFIFETFQFLTYNCEEKPFPFSEWPQSDVDLDEVEIIEAEAEDDVVPKEESTTIDSEADTVIGEVYVSDVEEVESKKDRQVETEK